jgi:hypothetical protein
MTTRSLRMRRLTRTPSVALTLALCATGSATAAGSETIESLTAQLHGSDDFPVKRAEVRFAHDPGGSLLMYVDASETFIPAVKRRFVVWFVRPDGRGYFGGTSEFLDATGAPTYVAGPAQAEQHNLENAPRITVTLLGAPRVNALVRRSRGHGWTKPFAVTGRTVLSGRISRAGAG